MKGVEFVYIDAPCVGTVASIGEGASWCVFLLSEFVCVCVSVNVLCVVCVCVCVCVCMCA